jgi:hypothetical protein
MVITPKDIKPFKNITGFLETPPIQAVNEGIQEFYKKKKLK